MHILGIDPGERTGWAVYNIANDCIIASGVMNGDNFVAAGKLVNEFNPSVIVCEKPFIRGKKKGLKKLMFRAGAWKTIAGIQNREHKEVNPATWQSFFDLKRGDKEAIRKIASFFVSREVDYDEADAILIAYCWACKEREREVLRNAE